MHLAGRARSGRSGDTCVDWLAAGTSVLFGFARDVFFFFFDTVRWLLHIEAWFRLLGNSLPLALLISRTATISRFGLRGSIREEKGVGYGVYLSVAGGDFA